jgi:hypothetical protein
MILVGRIVAGWAVGVLSMSVPVYQAECAHPKTRGLLVKNRISYYSLQSWKAIKLIYNICTGLSVLPSR